MTTFRKSVPKPSLVGAGAPNPKKGDVTLIYTDDILLFPERDANGVKMVGNIVLKPGAKMYKLYQTPTSQKASHTIEGDEDAEQFKQKFEGTHPGDELEVNEFVQNALGVGFIIIYGKSCGSNSNKVLGTPCNPMKLKGEFSDDKDGVKHTFTFEQYQGGRQIAGFYSGAINFGTNFMIADPEAAVINETNGNIYQVPATTEATAIAIATMTLAHGQIISLIGSGGSVPATLASGASTAVTIMLRDGPTWTALENAVINLQVFDAGATTYLVEVSRGA
jgi:hypothetical protein